MSNKILIVDDTEELLFFLEYLFNQNGFEVITAKSGSEAIRLAGETQPDVLLVDVMMPEINGLEVCRQVRTTLNMTQVPILLYSAAVGEEIHTEAMNAGADEFLGKTLHHVELLAKVRDWLASRSLQGGVGKQDFVQVGLDLLSLLEVELVWILGLHEGSFEHLAVACARGEQEARRFIDEVGRGPFAVDDRSLLGKLLMIEQPRLNVALNDLSKLEGGIKLASSLTRLGALAANIVPLHGPQRQRGTLVFPGPATLALGEEAARNLHVALRYASMALGRLPSP